RPTRKGFPDRVCPRPGSPENSRPPVRAATGAGEASEIPVVSRGRNSGSFSRLAAGNWTWLPYAVFFALLAISWGRWIEPYVDSGRELMVPWRLAHGESLYREIHFHHGPLAPYAGAAVDRLFGASLAARVGLALFVALFHLECLRRLTLRFLTAGRA